MPQVTEAKAGNEVEMLKMCNGLFKEWLVDLDAEEKQVWLWNALVEMLKIKQRKKA
ncbi:MAG: hypothetical protein ACM3IL_00630 [Deltaproteobacteria bacterium]